jgi:hypothetical protein
MGEIRNTYTILLGKPECKRQLGRPRHRWEDMDTREIVWEGVDWGSCGTGYGPLAGPCEQGNEPSVPYKAEVS